MAREDDRPAHTPAEGGSGEPGREMNPLDEAEEEAPSVGPHHIPIGHPVPEELYERLKRAPRTPPPGSRAQQDPAVEEDDTSP